MSNDYITVSVIPLQGAGNPPGRALDDIPSLPRDDDDQDAHGQPDFIPLYEGGTSKMLFVLCDDIADWVITGKDTLADLAARQVYYWRAGGEIVGDFEVPEGVDPAAVVSVSLGALNQINRRYLNGHVVAQFIGDDVVRAMMSLGGGDIEPGWFGHVGEGVSL